MKSVEIRYFATAREFRAWLKRNHLEAEQLWVGFHKKATGEPSMTWPESVDEALCVGWIDGIRKRVDEQRYTIRFTPRRTGSVWSAVNIRRMEQLLAEDRVLARGREAFGARRENRSGIYAYEQRGELLPEPWGARLKANNAAWKFWQAQPAGYRRTVGWWVVSAKQEATRERRFATLLDDCAAGRRIAGYR